MSSDVPMTNPVHVDPLCEAEICYLNIRGRCTCPPLALSFDRAGICKVLGEQLLQARSHGIPRTMDVAQEVLDGS